jgi:tRNA (cytosine38-C5)-methyltransferase
MTLQCSQSREALVKQLDSLNYEIQECLLSPVQFGIPNHRLRYYLIAFRRDGPSNAEDYIDKAVIHESWPFDGESINFVTPSISTFLDLEEANIERHLVPEKYLTKSNNFRFGNSFHILVISMSFVIADDRNPDIVKPSDHQTSCFTKVVTSSLYLS